MQDKISIMTTENYFLVPSFEAQIQESVMPLIAKKGNSLVQLGTGFTINENGLMMTASHVFTEAQKYSIRELDNEGKYYDHIEMYALLILNHREGLESQQRFGGLIRIQKAWINEEHDIALCFLEPVFIKKERFYFPKITLSSGIPKTGDIIIGVGYPDNRIEIPEDVELIKYFHKNAFTRGEIIEIYLTGRDMGMLPFPCFHTNAQFNGGMSGGPIFNENGNVCGVVCSGLPPSEEYPEYVSYGSLIAAALTIELEIAFNGNEDTENLTLYDLIKRGYVETDETIDDVGIHPRTVDDSKFDWF